MTEARQNRSLWQGVESTVVEKHTPCHFGEMVAKKADLRAQACRRDGESGAGGLRETRFDIKLSCPARVAAKPYLKDYTSPKFKHLNGKSSDVDSSIVSLLGCPEEYGLKTQILILLRSSLLNLSLEYKGFTLISSLKKRCICT
ncbi:hypothetical protein Gogos_001968 [Gossypium gossypioides]|uniref:Uncharacterized protein n=1 Tax=Gossypium gossypioides TaxID=34282 RepID=A0A7J9CPY0_GOSGO|nr:hypothetical protein [Gossypium gossypioides]